MLKEFREFALKGNMIDMAVGIVIGAAFGAVVSSFVNDVLMPIVAGLVGAPDFSNLFIVLHNPSGEAFTSVEAARDAGVVVLALGLFTNAVIAFLIVTASLFAIVRNINRMRRQAAPPAPPPPSREAVLLEEIRDLLRT